MALWVVYIRRQSDPGGYIKRKKRGIYEFPDSAD